MLFGIILIIIFFGFFVLLIWLSIKHETKESREPLSGEVRNHYFVKIILDITNEIKNLKGENEIKLFLREKMGMAQSIHKVTPYSDYTRDSILGGAFGMAGAILTTGAHDKTFKIDEIEAIQSMWAYYLSRQFNKDNFSKEEWKKIDKDIQNKTAYLLNSKVLLLTNQKDIKDAWMIILKDKSLTKKVFNQLWGQVRKMLFPEYK